MDWLTLWTAIAAPAIAVIALTLEILDRRSRKYGNPPAIRIERIKNQAPVDGWIALKISFRNDNDFSIVVTKLSCKTDKNIELTMGHSLPFGTGSFSPFGIKKSIRARKSSIFMIDCVIPSKETATIPDLDFETSREIIGKVAHIKFSDTLFVRSTDPHPDSIEVEISFTYHSTRFSNKNSIIKITSDPIENIKITTKEI